MRFALMRSSCMTCSSVLVVGLGDIVALIPMAALVAVMIMVSVGTFDWHSIKPATLRRMPKSETLVMVATVVVVVTTVNLAIDVVVGTVIAMVLFARRVARFTGVIDVAHPDENTRVYAVQGELFFASSNDQPVDWCPGRTERSPDLRRQEWREGVGRVNACLPPTPPESMPPTP